MKYSSNELKFIADRIDKLEYILTEWETQFFHSVRSRVLADIPLSSKQHECLSKIWDKLQEV